MNTHKTINNNHLTMINQEDLECGESIEEKVRQITETNAPIEAISPMIYTERKDGVKPEYNIRTDKWDIAQQAMTTIAEGKRQQREKRMTAQPDGDSKMNVQAGTQPA